jgi:5-methylcytosine-specific restriction endonuclease McrA
MENMTMDISIVTRKEAIEQGLTLYFTGVPCTRGHNATRFVSSYGCTICANENLKKQYDANPEKRREHSRQYRLDNIEVVKAKSIIRCAEWRAKFPERSKLSRNTGLTKWKAANPESVLAGTRNRRARIKGNEGSHTANDTLAILERQDFKCVACKSNLHTTPKHLDHIIPIKSGGCNWPSNLQWLCKTCNLRKGSKTMESLFLSLAA